MNFWSELVRWLAGSLTKEEAKVMREAGTRIVSRAWLVFFSCLAFGGFTFLGWPGFVRGDDMDRRIATAVQPLSVSVAQLAQAVKQLGTAANDQTLQLLRVAIVDAQVKKCRSQKAETAAIYRQQVLDAQYQYWKLTGQNYPAPLCADV